MFAICVDAVNLCNSAPDAHVFRNVQKVATRCPAPRIGTSRGAKFDFAAQLLGLPQSFEVLLVPVASQHRSTTIFSIHDKKFKYNKSIIGFSDFSLYQSEGNPLFQWNYRHPGCKSWNHGRIGALLRQLWDRNRARPSVGSLRSNKHLS